MQVELTIVTRRVENGDAGQAQLHVLIALTLGVGYGQVRLIVAVRGRDDAGGGEGATVLGLVAAGLRVRIRAVLSGDISTIVGAVGCVDGVEEVVE